MTLKASMKWLAILGVWLVAATVEAADEPILKTQKEKSARSLESISPETFSAAESRSMQTSS